MLSIGVEHGLSSLREAHDLMPEANQGGISRQLIGLFDESHEIPHDMPGPLHTFRRRGHWGRRPRRSLKVLFLMTEQGIGS